MSSDLELNLFERMGVKFKRLTGLGAAPNYLIIGGMKCASTALYWNLTQHPLVYAARKKEVQYFSVRYHKSWRWYTSNFPSRLSVALRRGMRNRPVALGEASPYYLFHPYAAERIKTKIPHVRLVAVLRHPIHRAYSHYQHNKRQGIEPHDFETALSMEDERLSINGRKSEDDTALRHTAFQYFTYKARGCYAEQLERWFKLFPREQIIIVQTERYQSHPNEVMAQVCEHLGLPAWDGFKHEHRNVGGYDSDIKRETYEQLHAYFEPHNRKLYELLGVDFGWA